MSHAGLSCALHVGLVKEMLTCDETTVTQSALELRKRFYAAFAAFQATCANLRRVRARRGMLSLF